MSIIVLLPVWKANPAPVPVPCGPAVKIAVRVAVVAEFPDLGFKIDRFGKGIVELRHVNAVCGLTPRPAPDAPNPRSAGRRRDCRQRSLELQRSDRTRGSSLFVPPYDHRAVLGYAEPEAVVVPGIAPDQQHVLSAQIDVSPLYVTADRIRIIFGRIRIGRRRCSRRHSNVRLGWAASSAVNSDAENGDV